MRHGKLFVVSYLHCIQRRWFALWKPMSSQAVNRNSYNQTNGKWSQYMTTNWRLFFKAQNSSSPQSCFIQPLFIRTIVGLLFCLTLDLNSLRKSPLSHPPKNYVILKRRENPFKIHLTSFISIHKLEENSLLGRKLPSVSAI